MIRQASTPLHGTVGSDYLYFRRRKSSDYKMTSVGILSLVTTFLIL